MPPYRAPYTFALTCISRAIEVRDRLFKPVPRTLRTLAPGITVSRESFLSGNNRIDAAFVRQAAIPPRAAIVLCHGIGETVDRWFPVQQLLALNGVASLVFDYSGYGSSTGRVDWRQSELDAIAAFQHLQSLVHPLPLSILGFSLGTGIAAAIIHKVPAENLILCAAFTSFRKGARSVGIPLPLSPLVPNIWTTQESLRTCPVPVLLVHGEKDGLFPVKMARDLAAACHGNAELVVVPNVAHNQPFRTPDLDFWGPVISWVIPEAAAQAASAAPQVPAIHLN